MENGYSSAAGYSTNEVQRRRCKLRSHADRIDAYESRLQLPIERLLSLVTVAAVEHKNSQTKFNQNQNLKVNV